MGWETKDEIQSLTEKYPNIEASNAEIINLLLFIQLAF